MWWYQLSGFFRLLIWLLSILSYTRSDRHRHYRQSGHINCRDHWDHRSGSIGVKTLRTQDTLDTTFRHWCSAKPPGHIGNKCWSVLRTTLRHRATLDQAMARWMAMLALCELMRRIFDANNRRLKLKLFLYSDLQLRKSFTVREYSG